MNASEYSLRMARFQDLLSGAADLAFIPLGTDLDYLTGFHRDLPNWGRVLHPGGWLEGAWLSPGRAPILTLPRMTADYGPKSGSDDIEIRILGDWSDPVALVRSILADSGIGDGATIATSDDADAETLIELQGLVPDVRFASATRLLRRLRSRKSPAEIETMREAGRITQAAFEDVVKMMRIGMTELDIITEVEFQLRRHGSLGSSFAASLYNSGPAHPRLVGHRLKSLPRRLTAPVSVLFDYGAIHDGMCYDFGRTVSFGEPSREFLTLHETVLEAQRAGIAALRAGRTNCAAVDARARAVISDAGYGDRFRHRLGHGIGWDVHEPPFLTAGDETPLEEGMIFTIEPSIMRDLDFSYRVEDCVVARSAGGEPLTPLYKDLVVIE